MQHIFTTSSGAAWAGPISTLSIQERSLPRLLGPQLLGSVQRIGQSRHNRWQVLIVPVMTDVGEIDLQLAHHHSHAHVGTKLHLLQRSASVGSMTSGLVGEMQLQTLPAIPPLVTMVATLLAMLVSSKYIHTSD